MSGLYQPIALHWDLNRIILCYHSWGEFSCRRHQSRYSSQPSCSLIASVSGRNWYISWPLIPSNWVRPINYLLPWHLHLHLSKLHSPTLQNQCLIFSHSFPWSGSFFMNLPIPELHVPIFYLYFLQSQPHSWTQTPESQQPAAHSQRSHFSDVPDQSQPTTKAHATNVNSVVFIILLFSLLYHRWLSQSLV